MAYLNKTWRLIPINEILVNGSYIFSTFIEYPTTEPFKIYAINFTLSRSIPEGWMRVSDFDNNNIQLTIADNNGKLIHQEDVYIKRVHEGIIIAVVKTNNYDYGYLYFNTHYAGGTPDDHKVTINSFRLTNQSEISGLSINQSVHVNGYYDTTLTATLDDEVDIVTDEHISEWKTSSLDGNSVTKMFDNVFTIVKLHNTNFVQVDYNSPIYLCFSTDCEVTSESPAIGISILERNNGDIRIISHQYIAINNKLLDLARTSLKKHKLYNGGDVYLKWGIREYGNRYIPDIYHLGMLGNIDDIKAMQILSGEVKELNHWKANTLASRPIENIYLGRRGLDVSEWRELGIPAMAFHYGKQIQYKDGVHNSWNMYVVIHYDSNGLLISISNANWEIHGNHYEIIPGNVVDELSYTKYTGKPIVRTGKIFAYENKLIDLTDDRDKLDVTYIGDKPIYEAKPGYNNTLYYRNQQHIVVYTHEFTKEEYLLGNNVITHKYDVTGLVIVWLNNKALIRGVDYIVSGTDIIITSSIDTNVNTLVLNILIRPDIEEPTIAIGYYDNGWDNPIVEALAESEVGILTQNGKRNRLSNSFIENGLYMAEYPSVQEARTNIVDQHKFDSELLNYHYLYNDKPKDYYEMGDYKPPIDPFIFAITNKILVTQDKILAEIDSYADIALFCKQYEYLIDVSRLLKGSVSAYPQNLVLTEYKYRALDLIVNHYDLNLNTTNIGVQNAI